MTMMKRFDKEFIERTLEILENLSSKTEYEVTLLLNCLLALVTLPIEREKESDLVEFQKCCNDKLKALKNDRLFIDKTKDENNFFRNIRNSIAHMHIKLEEGTIGNEIDSVVLKNYKSPKFCDFQVSISIKNLKEFAVFVAHEYLKILNEKEFELYDENGDEENVKCRNAERCNGRNS